MSLLLKNPAYKIPPQATFICSVPSLGNVGQLATDVILSSLNEKGLLERIGCIESDCILPVSGFDSFSTGPGQVLHLCMPVEVYGIVGKNIFVIHQRSPCFPGKINQYCQEFVYIINSLDYGNLILLTGAATDDHEIMNRSQMFAASTSVESKELSKEHSALPNELNALLDDDHFKKNALLDITKSVINMNICREKEEKAQLQSETELHLTENDFDSFLSSSSTVFTGFPNTQNYSENSFVSVGGMDQANNLFQIFMKSNELTVTSNSQNMTILGLFCAEGDNRPDGKKLAFTLLSNLKYDVKERSLPNPISWNVLYGAPMSESVMSMFY